MEPNKSRIVLRTPAAVGLVLAVGISLTLGANVLAQDSSRARSLRVAVVDIGLLFKNYKRKDAFEEEINGRRKRIKEELDADQKRLVAVRQEINQYREGSPPWLRAREKLQLAQYQLELKGKRLQAELKNAVEQQTLQILTELERTIGSFGRKYGYDLILKIDEADRSQAPGGSGELAAAFQERIFRAQISDVLYFQPKLDITKNVLTFLNSKDNLARMKRLAEERERERERMQTAPDEGEPK